jgi:hypothetical protein
MDLNQYYRHVYHTCHDLRSDLCGKSLDLYAKPVIVPAVENNKDVPSIDI